MSDLIAELELSMLVVLHLLIEKKVCTEDELLKTRQIVEAHIDAQVQKEIAQMKDKWRLKNERPR